ncbi:MAG: hypothetical protein OI715_00745 (plasmid) [Candidatus Methanoperedens sp.]|nr:MAG: hypothetical protein OI715_00745 [Candidatus Methanoperedens sp.]
MKKKFDKINVVDIEATCWEGVNHQHLKGAGTFREEHGKLVD